MIFLLILLLLFLILNLLYWIFIFSKFSGYENSDDFYSNKDVSKDSAILISIKNEAHNIKNNFHSLVEQEPQGFEFIIVDDYSTDDSIKLLNKISFQSKIQIFKNEFAPGKKQAISYAMSKINKEFILLTDADCFVKSKKWAHKMLSSFDEKISIVLGYSPYSGQSFFHKFIRFETFIAALQYFSYYLIGIPYMGVGRNMAIRKSFFINKKGYLNHMDIKSGNDDLFVNENANIQNTAIQIDPDTFVYTTPSENLADFIQQKTRHVSTSFRYKSIHKILLGLYSLSHIGFYIALIIGFFYLPLVYVIAAWAFRMIVLYISSYKSFNKLKESELLKLFPVFDFLMFVYYVYIGIYYFFAPKNKW